VDAKHSYFYYAVLGVNSIHFKRLPVGKGYL